MDGVKIYYECNKARCGDRCMNPDCHHTTDVDYAKNFRWSEDFGAYIEDPPRRMQHDVLCDRKDCIHRSCSVTTEGYGFCLIHAPCVKIVSGVNGPMCESYESEAEQ